MPYLKNPSNLSLSTSLLDKEKEGQDGSVAQSAFISPRHHLTAIKTLKPMCKFWFYQEYSRPSKLKQKLHNCIMELCSNHILHFTLSNIQSLSLILNFLYSWNAETAD